MQAVKRTRAAVHEHLTREIMYWNNRAQELKDQELAGKPNARLNSAGAKLLSACVQAGFSNSSLRSELPLPFCAGIC
jgi:hypothetical protein